jgi:hypothetical protein
VTIASRCIAYDVLWDTITDDFPGLVAPSAIEKQRSMTAVIESLGVVSLR